MRPQPIVGPRNSARKRSFGLVSGSPGRVPEVPLCTKTPHLIRYIRWGILARDEPKRAQVAMQRCAPLGFAVRAGDAVPSRPHPRRLHALSGRWATRRRVVRLKCSACRAPAWRSGAPGASSCSSRPDMPLRAKRGSGSPSSPARGCPSTDCWSPDTSSTVFANPLTVRTCSSPASSRASAFCLIDCDVRCV